MIPVWTWLPATSLFVLPVADSRAALSSVTLRWDEQFAIDATVAADFSMVEVQLGEVAVDFGLEAGLWAGFDPGDNLRFALVTVDGTFGFPLAVRCGPWSGRLELAHTSAHFADGVRDSGALPASSEGYSREWLSVLGSRDIGPARVYAGGHVLVHDQRGAPPLGLQVGGELVAPWKVAPYLAIDVQVADEFAWTPAFAAQLGLALAPHAGQRFRVALAGRTGPDDTGKLSGDTERWLGVTFGFDTTGRLSAPPNP